MNRRLLFGLLLVFVALAALLAIQRAQPRTITGATVVPTKPPVFTDVTMDTLQAIRLRSPETGQSLLLSRNSDWEWTAPELSGTLDAKEADLIARTMIVLPFNRTMPLPADADMATFGFTPEGILSIELLLVDGGAHAIAVGYRTPTADSYYALVDDRSDLYLIERAAVDFLISRVKNPPAA